MNERKFTTLAGKAIDIYDGVVPSLFRNDMFSFANSLSFRLGWIDGQYAESATRRHLHAALTHTQLYQMGLFDAIKNTPIEERLADMIPSKSVCNLSNPSDVYFPHTHPSGTTVLLYYVNPVWDHSWYGETIFYSEDEKDIELALPYTPGRIVVFDATIPHAIRPPSSACVDRRYTLSVEYIKKGT